MLTEFGFLKSLMLALEITLNKLIKLFYLYKWFCKCILKNSSRLLGSILSGKVLLDTLSRNVKDVANPNSTPSSTLT